MIRCQTESKDPEEQENSKKCSHKNAQSFHQGDSRGKRPDGGEEDHLCPLPPPPGQQHRAAPSLTDRLMDGTLHPPCVKEMPLPRNCQNGTTQAALCSVPPMMPERWMADWRNQRGGSARSQQKTDRTPERTGEDVWSPERRAGCLREETPADGCCW